MIKTPIVDIEREFRVWLISQLYDGPDGMGNIVPNVDDMVIDWDNGVYRVISVDHGKTNLHYKVRVNIAALGGGYDDSDIAVITGPGANSNAFRVYIDTSTTPHTMALDSRMIWNGSENAYVKVFKGTDTSAKTGVVVSAIITSTGRVTSENLPLTAVVVPNGTNVSMKTASTGYCTETLKTGDVVSVVTYTAAGVVTSVDKFVVVNTNLVRSIDQSAKYVADIELLSPYISKTDKKLIECPINMLTQSLNFSAKVTYTDGTSAIANIDGKKWSLAGMDMYVATQIGQVGNVVLVYTLGATENSTDAITDRKVRKEYRIRTTAVDAFYAIKLFAAPVWNTSTKVYDLKWYLYNLDRKDILDVTNYVEYATTSPKFNGGLYNSTQTLQVALNMESLGPTYSYFRHVQVVAITLTNPAAKVNSTNYFKLSYKDNVVWGESARATYVADTANQGKYKLNVSCGYGDSLTWLTHVYKPLDALYFNTVEIEPPTPTHARILVGTGASAWQREIPITDITQDISNVNFVMSQGTPVRIELFRKETTGNLQLAVAPFVATAM